MGGAKGVKRGDVVRIENAFASMFRNELQINLNWRGIVLPAKSSDSLATLERDVGYTFNNKELLLQALTRRSYAYENPEKKTKTGEPLSFLSDAVLDLAVSEYLLTHNPELAEDDLTARFQGLTNGPQCAAVGTKLRLHKYLRLGGGERPPAQTAPFMEEAYEALIGAVFLDGLYGSASAVVKRTLLLTPT